MKRFRRRMSHTFHTQSLNNESGLSDLAECLSIRENGDISKNGSQRLGFLARASRRLSFSTSRIMDILSNNSTVPDTPHVSPQKNYRGVVALPVEERRMSREAEDPWIQNGKLPEVPLRSRRHFSESLVPRYSGRVVHEDPRIGSDGESEEASGASDEVVSPVKLRARHRRVSQQDISKRLSLPADVLLPESFLVKQSVSPTLEGPISRTLRRQSLSEIGFGRMESYVKLHQLGEGTYATVHKGRSRLTGAPVALKEIRLEHEEGAPCTAIREVSILKDLKHNNIVTLHDVIHTDRCLTLVFEYLEYDLQTHLNMVEGCETPQNVQIFLFQLLRGLEYCHRRKVLHRDLKPQNLLINELGELKLADFGLARAKSVPTKTYSNEVVTLWYRPPDVLLGSTEYSTSIDLWGVGCIFYEMVTKRPLFPGSSVAWQLQRIFRSLGKPNKEVFPDISITDNPNSDDVESLKTFASDLKVMLGGNFEVNSIHVHSREFSYQEPFEDFFSRMEDPAKDLLYKLLKYDPKQRISASEALKHPYFNNFDPKVHKLPDTASIFSIPSIVYKPSAVRKKPLRRVFQEIA